MLDLPLRDISLWEYFLAFLRESEEPLVTESVCLEFFFSPLPDKNVANNIVQEWIAEAFVR